ncbi:MAG: sporulation protein YunB [Firmicutes bacterium]|nr:sporulation protein YunB [Bacillota bacterium]
MRLRWQSKLYRKKNYSSSVKADKLQQKQVKKPLPLLKFILLIIMFIILLSVLTAIIIEWRVSPVIHAWAQTRAIGLATRAINLAIEETMAISISTAEMAVIKSDDQGQIQAIQYNTGEINRVSSSATHKVLQSLFNLGDEIFPVPLGQLLGLDFLAGWGPGIPIKIIPAGSVTTTPVSSFHAAGINQTIHRIYLDVKVEMRVVIPWTSVTLPVSTRFPIIEEVIIGSVPSWYFAPGGIVGGFGHTMESDRQKSDIEFDLTDFGL